MKAASAQAPKQIKPPNRSPSLFSCTFFRHCTDTPLSPTLPPPPLPPPPISPPPSLPPTTTTTTTKQADSSESSSTSSTSQSFTQWRFPPTFPPQPPPLTSPQPSPPPPLTSPSSSSLHELFHVAEISFSTGSHSDRLSSLLLLERSLVPNPPSTVVPTVIISGVVAHLKDNPKPATKVLLALCLSESNRRVAVECGAAARVVDALPDMAGPAAERALAALELMCTVPEGAAEVRSHALAVPMLVEVMGRMEGRGREYAIGVLAAVYGGAGGGGDSQLPPEEEVARAVVLAMQQGDCSARGKRKGAQLLKALQDNGRLDLTQET